MQVVNSAHQAVSRNRFNEEFDWNWAVTERDRESGCIQHTFVEDWVTYAFDRIKNRGITFVSFNFYDIHFHKISPLYGKIRILVCLRYALSMFKNQINIFNKFWKFIARKIDAEWQKTDKVKKLIVVQGKPCIGIRVLLLSNGWKQMNLQFFEMLFDVIFQILINEKSSYSLDFLMPVS